MYVKSRAEVGEACKTKRPTSCVMICKPKDDELKKKYAQIKETLES